MEALASSLLVFIPTTSAFLVYKYAQKEVSCHIKTMTALSWLFCFSAYALLPIDIYYTTHHPFSSDRPTIETAWTLIYWGNFAFSWVILPFFMAYETCGEFDILSKTKRALLENLIYYVYFALGMLPLLIFTYSLGLLDKIKWIDFAVAASNSIGIFLCIICMSYSLPYVPTRLLKNPNNKERLKQLQYEISLCKTLLTNMRIALVDNIAKLDIYQNHPHLNEELRPYLDEIKGRIPDSFYQRAMIHVRGIEQPDSKGKVLKNNKDVTLGKLVVLHKNVKHLREEITRLKMKQQCLIDNAVFIEDLLDSTYTFNSSMKDVTTSITNFNPSTSTRLRIRFMISIWPNLAKILGIVSAILSCLLILIEVLGLLNKSIEEFLKGIISRRDNWAVATISLTIFCYAIFTVHFAVFRFKFSGFYNLYYDHQTDTASLLYSGIVSSALCLNILSILNIENSSFNQVMGTFSVVPVFGETFQKFFPLTLLFFVIFNITDVYGKVMKVLGMKHWDFNRSNGDELQTEGKLIVQRRSMS